MCGVLPVPPTLRLPTDIIGILNLTEVRIPKSNSLLRSCISKPYKTEIGYSIIRNNTIPRKYILKCLIHKLRIEIIKKRKVVDILIICIYSDMKIKSVFITKIDKLFQAEMVAGASITVSSTLNLMFPPKIKAIFLSICPAGKLKQTG